MRAHKPKTRDEADGLHVIWGRMKRRDPKRIAPFLKLLEKAWALNPDLRFHQLVAIIAVPYAPSDGDCYSVEDDKPMKSLAKLVKDHPHAH